MLGQGDDDVLYGDVGDELLDDADGGLDELYGGAGDDTHYGDAGDDAEDDSAPGDDDAPQAVGQAG